MFEIVWIQLNAKSDSTRRDQAVARIDGELLERFAAAQDEAAEMAFAALVERHGADAIRKKKKRMNRKKGTEAISAPRFAGRG
jgi:hypothetical protein